MTAEQQPTDDGTPAETDGTEPDVTDGDAASDLAAALQERTSDLQRVTAEYHNYRKRVERDKAAAAEAATAAVVAALLPVLDDLDRAREHGDLVGPFGSVAESLQSTLTKLGLEVFGEKGDAFDPMVHEAVAHMHSVEVTEPSCIDVMRRGYRLGDRLLRAAMVAVAEPAPEAAPVVETEPESESTDEATDADATSVAAESTGAAEADASKSPASDDGSDPDTTDGDADAPPNPTADAASEPVADASDNESGDRTDNDKTENK